MLMAVMSMYWMVREALELWLVHRPTQKHQDHGKQNAFQH
jgi:hypothetical protein